MNPLVIQRLVLQCQQMSIKSVKVKGTSGARKYSFTLSLYNISYDVFVGETIHHAANAAQITYPGLSLKEDVGPQIGGYAIELSHPEEGLSFLILLTPDISNTDKIPGICAHESLHLSWFISDALGIKNKKNNHEPQAYILQEIFNNCMRAYTDYTNKQNKKN